MNCNIVAWISHNQLACGYSDGMIEIHEMVSRNRQLKSRMVQKIRHDLGDGPALLLFSLFDLKVRSNSAVLSIAWNEELNLLASSGTDQRVKVLKPNVFYLLYSKHRCKLLLTNFQ